MDSSGGGELFEVESIIGKRQRHGKIEYLVRWKGFDPNEDSWEPVKNLQGCHNLIKQFTKTRSPSPARRARTPKSKPKEDIEGEFTKLKYPKISTPVLDNYIVIHRKGGPLSPKKEVNKQKEIIKTTNCMATEQEINKESVNKETPVQEDNPNGKPLSRTTNGNWEVFKVFTFLVLVTLIGMLLLSLIPPVGVIDK